MGSVIHFERVSKSYRLGSSVSSLQDTVQGLLSQFRRGGNPDPERRYLTALQDVSFEVNPGEAVGVIGPNGAGKSTILKLISKITRADSGRILVNGRVSALLELGAGFHPDLTGRENIYLNAAILGMSRREINSRFDSIVCFSELERFLDTPVKRYSSGMYCRLGFSVAAHAAPDIFLVDEVLAVGDAAFQAKCLGRMSELRRNGTTILFVSHNLGYLHRLCRRAIFINAGGIHSDGPVTNVIEQYRNHTAYASKQQLESARKSRDRFPEQRERQAAVSPVRIKQVSLHNGETKHENSIRTGETLTVQIKYDVSGSFDKGANFEVWIYGIDGTEYASFATAWDGLPSLKLNGDGEVRLKIDPFCLMPGTYFINVAISDREGLAKYDLHWERHVLTVLSGPPAHGLVHLPHEWFVGQGN